MLVPWVPTKESLGRNERALLILFPPFYTGSLEVQSRLLIDQPVGTTTTPSTAPTKASPKREKN